MMTEKDTHFIEISKETLYKIQKMEDIEIEYRDIDTEKQIMLIDRQKEKHGLDGIEEGFYGIGLHGIGTGDFMEKQNIASQILKQGLNINNNSKTIN